MQEWTAHREVTFTVPGVFFLEFLKSYLLLRAATHEKPQPGVPFLVPDPAPCYPVLGRVFALGERPFYFTRRFQSTNYLFILKHIQSYHI